MALSLAASGLIGAGISGASSLISGLFGGASQNRFIDKQIKAQADENEKVRKENFRLAVLQNKWNKEQWEAENAYNDPKQQMARLRGAGLNPDLMYGQGVSGLTSASSPEMTSGAPVSPQDLSALGMKTSPWSAIGGAIDHSLDTSLKMAQIRNLDAQSENTKEDTKGKAINNETLRDMNSAELANKLAELGLTKAQTDEVLQNIEVARQTIVQMDEQVKLWKAQIKDMKKSQRFKRLQLAFEKGKFSKEFALKAEELGLKKQEVAIAMKKLPYELNLLFQQKELTSEQVALTFAKTLSESTNNEKLKAELVSIQQLLESNQIDLDNKQALHDLTKNSPGWRAFWLALDAGIGSVGQVVSLGAGVTKKM